MYGKQTISPQKMVLLERKKAVGDYGGSVDSLTEGMGTEISLEDMKAYP
ncbi:hypothetical protein Q9966_009941 [Columba livia]|nr:hypothetical protein Q9966_009941 [Columba livia]